MANYNEQIVRLWDEWEAETGDDAGDPDDFLDWALANRKIQLAPQDLKTIMRRRVSTALRQVTRINEDGLTYRGKQCVIDFEDGRPVSHYFDTDTGGSPRLRAKAIKQRRDAIANDVYRAQCDSDHMNKRHGENNLFIPDFTDDCLEKRAADLLDRNDDDAA